MELKVCVNIIKKSIFT